MNDPKSIDYFYMMESLVLNDAVHSKRQHRS